MSKIYEDVNPDEAPAGCAAPPSGFGETFERMKRRPRWSLLAAASMLMAAGGCNVAPSGTADAPGSEAEVQPAPAAAPEPPRQAGEPLMSHRDYSFGYYLNGWRSRTMDKHPDILAYETGYYGFLLDVADLTRARFGLLDDGMDYEQALEAESARMENLPPAELDLSVTVNGTRYRAVSSRAGRSQADNRMQDLRLWEAGQFAQNFELYDVKFENEAGEPLPALASLFLVGWPDSLALTAQLTPDMLYRDGPAPGISGAGVCVMDTFLDLPLEPGADAGVFTLEMWMRMPEALADDRRPGWILCRETNEWADSNFGFYYDRFKAYAVMNIGGGPTNQVRIPQTAGHLAHDQWMHLALSYDGQSMKFYVDGTLQGSEDIGRTRMPGQGVLRLGKRGDGSMHIVPGLYDEVRIWSRALSTEEIAHHAKNPTQISSRGGMMFRESFERYDRSFVPPSTWTNAEVSISLKGPDGDWSTRQAAAGTWKPGELRSFTLACDVRPGRMAEDSVSVSVRTPDGTAFPAAFDPLYNGIVANVNRMKRSFDGGYRPIREYDEFYIDVDNTGDEKRRIPFMLYMIGTANTTGLVPMLCDENGVPTGLHVQLSKNWHYSKIGDYLRAYMTLPAPAGKTTRYLLRIPYGFYGTLPSASHAQLSLVGWGGNGRWDQLAVGCWGETICFDMDMSPTPQVITDVRALMVRNGPEGKEWGWTDAGWGGDWFNVAQKGTDRLAFTRMKTAYLAHGPCLTDVRYAGFYGAGREVEVDARVHTMRADDIARTAQRIRYTFNRSLPADDAYFFRMDGHSSEIPVIAYGNKAGLIEERSTLGQETAAFIERVALDGEGPWWIAFPGSRPDSYTKNWGTASRGLIIRGYRASFGGQLTERPSITVPGDFRRYRDLSYDMLLTPPAGVKEIKAGDWVEMDVIWITVPRTADDYYGPNEAFRRHLADHPASWRTVHREAAGNDLQVTVDGGTVTGDFPLIIQALRETVTVNIRGGVGFVPVRFDGLAAADGYSLYESAGGIETKLDQSVRGNDFWQTDYDADAGTYSITFNVPLDGKPASTWILRRE